MSPVAVALALLTLSVPQSVAEREVAEAIRTVRANVGGWCGTPNLTAHERVKHVGKPAVPYLKRALEDSEPAVVGFAAHALRSVDTPTYFAWCRTTDHELRERLCKDFERLARPVGVFAGNYVVSVPAGGGWKSVRNLFVRLVVTEDGGVRRTEVCVTDGCIPVAESQWDDEGVTFDLPTTEDPVRGVRVEWLNAGRRELKSVEEGKDRKVYVRLEKRRR
ncbi:MAG: hypothetical protein RIT81_29210 [Deltaproteobacteria bacterium]